MLPKNSYNAGLIRFQGRLLLSYRVHDRKDWRTNLGIAELSDSFAVGLSKPIKPPDELKDNSFEDCRFFVHRNALWISFTVSQWPATEFRSIVAISTLTETPTHWEMSKPTIPQYGRNAFDGIEKNFIFISRGETLWCIYRVTGNEQIVLQLDGARVEEVFKAKALPWAKAEIHGGAVCEGPNGNLYHFFNSHTSHKDRQLDRYFVGCAELSGLPPFDMLRISSAPILSGEEGYCLDKNPRFKPNVVFVCGAIYENGQFLVSFGFNDCQCKIEKLTQSQLRL